MKSKIEILLDKLCVEQGFCLSEREIQKIASKNHLYAEEFSKLVLIGEGMDPEIEIEHFRNIKRLFSDLFGNEFYESDFNLIVSTKHNKVLKTTAKNAPGIASARIFPLCKALCFKRLKSA